MPDDVQQTDVAIVGAGPVGLFAIFELGMLDMHCQVLDALDVIGGQCAALYPEKPIYDIPGYPRIAAQELIDRLVEQAAPFQPGYHLGHPVTALERLEGGGWRLTTGAGVKIEAKAILIAAGGGAFGPNRPPLAGIEAYENRSVHYLVKRREDFRDKRIVIAGGGDSAVDWALSLADVARQTYVVHRRQRFRAAPEGVNRLTALAESGAVELVIPYQLAGLEGQNGLLNTIIVRSLEGEERRLEADSLLAFYGLAMDIGPLAGWGLELERNQIVVDPATCQTNLAGIFAIGESSPSAILQPIRPS